MARHITTGFPAPFPLVTPAHIAGPKPGLDGTALLRASTRVQSVPLRPGNIGNPETLDETQLNGVLSQINPTFGLEAES
jgi:hypothetical protein